MILSNAVTVLQYVARNEHHNLDSNHSPQALTSPSYPIQKGLSLFNIKTDSSLETATVCSLAW